MIRVIFALWILTTIAASAKVSRVEKMEMMRTICNLDKQLNLTIIHLEKTHFSAYNKKVMKVFCEQYKAKGVPTAAEVPQKNEFKPKRMPNTFNKIVRHLQQYSEALFKVTEQHENATLSLLASVLTDDSDSAPSPPAASPPSASPPSANPLAQQSARHLHYLCTVYQLNKYLKRLKTVLPNTKKCERKRRPLNYS